MKYKNTKRSRLLDRYGEQTIQGVWYILGHRKTAEYFKTTVSVIRSIVEDKEWKRPIEFMPSLHRAINSGARRKEEFKHIDFSGEFIRELNEKLEGDDLLLPYLADHNPIKHIKYWIEPFLKIQNHLTNKK